MIRTIHNESERRLLSGDATVPRVSIVRNSLSRANYTVRETCALGTIQASSSGATFGAFVHQFNDLTNASSWVALFDRYRFKSVKVTFQQVGVQMSTPTSLGFEIPKFCTVVDFDDSSAYTAFATMSRAATAATHSSTYDIVRHYLPRATVPVYISGVSTGYQESDPMAWKDLAYPNIPHYGVKWGIDYFQTGSLQPTYNVIAEYVIELAGQRG